MENKKFYTELDIEEVHGPKFDSEEAIIEMSDDKVYVYQSDNLISSMAYAGPASSYMGGGSDNISEEVAGKFKQLKGFVSFGLSDGYKNFHIYSQKAIALDSLYRMAYVSGQKDADFIKVSECRSQRGSKYSALYRILEDKMILNGFKRQGKSFLITNEQIELFVQLVNEVDQGLLDGEYVLIKDGLDYITFSGKKVGFFDRVYWVTKNEDKSNIGNDFNLDLLKQQARGLTEVNDLNLLDRVSNVLKVMEDIVQSKKTTIKSIDLLND